MAIFSFFQPSDIHFFRSAIKYYPSNLKRKAKGFSLLELMLTMVVLGILSVGMFGFIRTSVDGYNDARDRDVLQSQARFVVERLTRELRQAVPNSLVTSNSNTCLIYTPIQYAGYHQKLAANTSKLEVAMSSVASDWREKIPGKRIVFMPMKREDLTEQIKVTGAKKSYEILSVALNQLTLSKAINAPWPDVSFSKRFYIYDKSVTFCFKNNNLVRKVDSGKDIVLATHVALGSRFEVSNASLSQANLVNVNLKFAQHGEISVYNQQIQVSNAP